jgi:hypothetical protein
MPIIKKILLYILIYALISFLELGYCLKYDLDPNNGIVFITILINFIIALIIIENLDKWK